jgi:iron(III) transport system substrate-binding protein
VRPVAILAAIGLLAAAAQAEPLASARYGPEDGAPLVIWGTTDIEPFAPALKAFAADRPDLRIDYQQWVSTPLFARSLVACADEADAPDLIVSSSVDQQVRLVNDGCARPHRSSLTAALPRSANWRDELFGVTVEPAVMVYNRELVPPGEAPRSRFDLIDLLRSQSGRYAGRVATYDIETSGLGYLFAFADSLQATTFGSLIEAFGRSGAVATCCSAEIIDGVAEGRWLIAYNVLGSYALARADSDPRLAVVLPEDYVLVLTRAAMIPKHAPAPEPAGAFVDFLLSPEGRAALAKTRLIADLGRPVTGMPGGMPAGDATLRPISLSPVLLLGLDHEKRAQFLARWRLALGRH